MSRDLLLTNGTLVSAADAYRANLLIREGRIAAIGNVPAADADVLDVSDCLVMPGGIDTHVHLAHPIDRLGVVTADDFYTGTVAAACGGVTTIIDFAVQRRGAALEPAVAARAEQAAADVVIDFGLHVIVTDVGPSVLDEIPSLVDAGFPSFKIYMTYRDKIVDDGGLLRVLERTGAAGGLVYVHCENDCAIGYLVDRHLGRGDSGPAFHATSRPPVVEGEATNRAIMLAEIVGAPLCVAHVTSVDGLRPILAGRERGARVFGETCPQYLVLSDDRYQTAPGFEAAKYVCSPPLRGMEHQAALWRALRSGGLQQVSSDHAPFRFADQKPLGQHDFTRIPNGVPGIETRLPLLFSEGVSSGRLSLTRFVELTATNPAKLFGLYPAKGSLAIGADADLVVFDPNQQHVLHHDTLHHAVDYSPFEGMSLRGYPILTIARGDVIVRDGRPNVSRGRGRLVHRQPIHPDAI